jgi:hypothetical protein
MAGILYVTEFSGTGNKGLNGGISDYPAVPALGTQVVTTGAASAATTNALSAACDKVAVSCTTACSIVFGKTPVATVNDLRLQVGVVYMFTVAGKDLKVAAIE